MALLAGVSTPVALNVVAAPVPAAIRAAVTGTPPSLPGSIAEHRYRIVGKLRLALFWIERDDVGSARMTWRSDGTTNAVTFLVGSDPQRAPRSVNQWGYLREEVGSNHAQVFSLRSLGDDEAEPSAGFTVGEGPLFGVSCASATGDDVSSTHTTVNGHGVTYRMFERLLDRITVSAPWEERHTRRPPGADAGFLTALQHAIRVAEVAGAASKAAATRPPLTYVYDNAVYDLSIRGSQSLGQVTVGTRTFERLVRTDFSIRNRMTEDVSKFAVTHSPDRAGSLPVQIFYQPNFWLRIELRLDDEADAPADPAADASMLTRIRAMCADRGR